MRATDPRPVDFDSYRDFLRAWLEHRAGRPSLRTLARRMQCSPSLLSRVISGERDLEPRRVPALLEALRVEEVDQIELLTTLIEAEHGATEARRRQAAQRVEVARRMAEARPIPARQALRGPGIALLELLRCPLPDRSPEALGALLRPPVPPEEVRRTLEGLIEAGVVEREGLRPVPSTLLSHLKDSEAEDWLRGLTAAALERARADLAEPDGKGLVVTLALPASRREALEALTRRYLADVIALSEPYEAPAQVLELVLHVHAVSEEVG